jgi:hypothetical protein
MTGLPSVRVDDILIHPRDRDLIIGTHGRSIWICDDITPLEQLKGAIDTDLALFEPRPVVVWKNDPQAQRHATNRDFKGQNPQGGTAINIWAKSAIGEGKVEFLQNNKVVSSMDVDIKEGMNRFQWGVRALPEAGATAGAAGGRRGGGSGEAAQAATGAQGNPPGAGAQTAEPGGGRGGRGAAGSGVPFLLRGGGGGNGGGAGAANAFTGLPPAPTPPGAEGGRGGGGFGFGAAPQILDPGTYMVRLTAGGKTLQSSVVVLDDIWMRPQ